MGWPVNTVSSGGIPVTVASNGFGTPIDEAPAGLGTAVTQVPAGGIPVVPSAPQWAGFTPLGVLARGDSRTFGIGGTAPWPGQFQTNTGQATTNQGFSGATLNSYAAWAYDSETAPLYNAATLNTLFLWLATNDFGNEGATDLNVRSYFITVSGKAKATGWKFVVASEIPRSDAGWDATKEGYRLAWNAWLRQNWPTYADGFLDLARVPELQDPNNTVYFNDKLHLTNRGYRVISEAVRNGFKIANVNDTTPSAFSFTDVTNASTSTQYTSNAVEITGFTAAAAVSVTGGSYSINGGSFTSAAGLANPYDQVQARQTSSSSSSTQTDTVVTIGGVSDTYSVTTAAPYQGPGDLISSVTALSGGGLSAYNTAYIGGPAIDVIRASDSATMTINTVAGGGIDIAALTTFLTSTTGKVSKIYDQTGNGRHLVNATSSQQPSIVLNALSGKPTMRFTAAALSSLKTAANVTQAQPVSHSVVFYTTGTGTGANQYVLGDTNARGMLGRSGSGNNFFLFSGGFSVNVANATNTWYSSQTVYNGSSSSIRLNGTLTGSLTAGGDGWTQLLTLGSTDQGATFDAMEIYFWAGALSSGDQTAINTNRRAFYNF